MAFKTQTVILVGIKYSISDTSLVEILREALIIPKYRKRTKIPRSIIKKRLKNKRLKSERKASRKKPKID